MSNPLFSAFGNNAPVDNGILGFLKEVQNFQKSFKGNPKDEVQRMLNSGQISQAQFNQFAQMANQIMAFMPK